MRCVRMQEGSASKHLQYRAPDKNERATQLGRFTTHTPDTDTHTSRVFVFVTEMRIFLSLYQSERERERDYVLVNE